MLYFIKGFLQLFLLKKDFAQINFTLKSILLKYDYFYYCLWYQKTYQIMEEYILNCSPTVMFRGTPWKPIN